MKTITEKQARVLYDEYLDEAFGTIKIAGYTYCTSQALKLVDEIAYDQGFLDWIDYESMSVEGYD